jgi:hypothetical protein
MKAVIVELRGKYAAALLEDGSVVKVRDKQYTVGQEIQAGGKRRSAARKLAVWAACLAVFILSGSLGAYACLTPYAYVSVDGDSAVEYSLNRFDRVLSVRAVDTGGQEVTGNGDLENLKFKTIDEALAITVDQLTAAPKAGSESNGNADGNPDSDPGNVIVIAASAPDTRKADLLKDKLQKIAEKGSANSGKKTTVETVNVTQEEVKQAKKLGVTPGKLDLVKKLQQSTARPEAINPGEWLQKPVKEIVGAIGQNKKAAAGATPGSATKTEPRQGKISGKKQPAAPGLTKPKQKGNGQNAPQQKNQEKTRSDHNADKTPGRHAGSGTSH